MSKLVVRLARILPLCALLLSIPTLAASQSVTLQPAQGTVGTGITASGSGWPASTVVHVFFNQQEIPGAPAISNSNGSFTLNFCVPNLSPGVYPTFFTIGKAGTYSGPIFTIAAGTAGNCNPSANNCPNVYFIGVHGIGEDAGSPELDETWQVFNANRPTDKTAHYISLAYHAPDFKSWNDIANLIVPAEQEGVQNLTVLIRKENNGILRNCPTQSIVLVGYSLGAWIVNDWLDKNMDIWPNIVAVELYGDPLWEHWVNDFGQNRLYAGLAQFVVPNSRPYEGDSPQGPLGITGRWQSRCLPGVSGEPICGEGYSMLKLGAEEQFEPVTNPSAGQFGYIHPPNQALDAVNCVADNCPHLKYFMGTYNDQGVLVSCNYGSLITDYTGQKTCDQADFAPTTRGGYWLALKAFPLVPASATPQIVQIETFREGVLVYFRIFFTNPNNSATGFGFQGTTAQTSEDHTWKQPSYGRVSLGVSPAKLEYPFNLGCTDTGSGNGFLSLNVWIDYGNGQKSKALVDLSCSAPNEEATPFAASSAIK